MRCPKWQERGFICLFLNSKTRELLIDCLTSSHLMTFVLLVDLLKKVWVFVFGEQESQHQASMIDLELNVKYDDFLFLLTCNGILNSFLCVCKHPEIKFLFQGNLVVMVSFQIQCAGIQSQHHKPCVSVPTHSDCSVHVCERWWR